MSRAHIIILLCLLPFFSVARQQQADTLKVLPYEEYIDMVLAYHPVVSQARLLTDAAEGRVLEARGYFDPKIESDYRFKQFKGSEYYDNWFSALKIPLYIPVDLKVAYERNRGINVNPENTVPEEGLWSVGVSIPVLQGLITDERRTTLRTARLYTEIARAEQQKEISKALLNAAKDYWNWYYAYYQYQLLRENEELAAFRFQAVRQQVLNGDVAPIDSVEAKIALQTRDASTRQSAVELLNAVLKLNLNLWGPDRQPMYLSEEAVPSEADASTVTADLLNQLLESALENHPELIKVRLKASTLQLERRLYQNQLLPDATLEYNLLSNQDHQFESSEGEPLFWNNYKLGATLSWPIFMRKERGKLAQNRVKMDQNTFEREFANREVMNQITMAYNSLLTYNDLTRVQGEAVSNYEILVRGENIKFENGESSLFLVNSRENKLIEARLKLLKIRTDKEKALAGLLAETGDPSLWPSPSDAE